MPHRVPISPQCKMNFWATGVKLFFGVSLIFPFQVSPLLSHPSRLLVLLIQNIQLFPSFVKRFLTCPFSGLPCRSPRLRTNLHAISEPWIAAGNRAGPPVGLAKRTAAVVGW